MSRPGLAGDRGDQASNRNALAVDVTEYPPPTPHPHPPIPLEHRMNEAREREHAVTGLVDGEGGQRDWAPLRAYDSFGGIDHPVAAANSLDPPIFPPPSQCV